MFVIKYIGIRICGGYGMKAELVYSGDISKYVVARKNDFIFITFSGIEIVDKTTFDKKWELIDFFGGQEALLSRNEKYLVLKDSTSYVRIYDLEKRSIVITIDILSKNNIDTMGLSLSLDDDTFYVATGYALKNVDEVGDIEKAEWTVFRRYSFASGDYIDMMEPKKNFVDLVPCKFANGFLLVDNSQKLLFYSTDDGFSDIDYPAGQISPLVDEINKKVYLQTNYGVRVLDEDLKEENSINFIGSRTEQKRPYRLFQALNISDADLPMSLNEQEDVPVEEIINFGNVLNKHLYCVFIDNERRRSHLKITNIETSDNLMDLNMGYQIIEAHRIDDNNILLYGHRYMQIMHISE